jgi:hypothetical protein
MIYEGGKPGGSSIDSWLSSPPPSLSIHLHGILFMSALPAMASLLFSQLLVFCCRMRQRGRQLEDLDFLNGDGHLSSQQNVHQQSHQSNVLSARGSTPDVSHERLTRPARRQGARILTAVGDIVSIDALQPSGDGRFTAAAGNLEGKGSAPLDQVQSRTPQSPCTRKPRSHKMPHETRGGGAVEGEGLGFKRQVLLLQHNTVGKGSASAHSSISSYIGDESGDESNGRALEAHSAQEEDNAPAEPAELDRRLHPDEDSLAFARKLRMHNLKVGRERVKQMERNADAGNRASSRVRRLEALWPKEFEEWPQFAGEACSDVDQMSLRSGLTTDSSSPSLYLEGGASPDKQAARHQGTHASNNGLRKRSDMQHLAPGSSKWAAMALKGSRATPAGERGAWAPATAKACLDARHRRIAGVDASAAIVLARSQAKRLEAMQASGTGCLLYAHSWDAD